MTTQKTSLDGNTPQHVIGTRPLRAADTEKVIGKAVYGIDAHLSGMLSGAILRSPHAHARILSVDTRQAENLPGVLAVVTAADLPVIQDGATAGDSYLRNNILAHDKVLYDGHAVAAVAAIDLHIAEQALSLIHVTYEVLPLVLDVEQAMQEGAPLLHEGLHTDELGRKSERPSNIASHSQVEWGDVDKGFAEAAVVVEHEFHTATVHQGYIEPQAATALYEAGGQITIWSSTQGAFSVRQQVSAILDIPVAHIRVVPLEIGGGFGGKNDVYLEPVAVLLSKKSGHRPVKMVMSHAEVLVGTGPTSASYIKVKMGANQEGRITALSAFLAYAAGAFPGSFIETAMEVIYAAYRIENGRVDGYDVVVNRPKSAAYRAPGGSNAIFASETVVDELCEKLKMDPIEFRRRNAVREGDRRVDGRIFKRIGFFETLQAIKDHPHYSAPLGGLHRGRGLASTYWGNGGGTSSASASINPDGTVNVVTGSVDLSGTRMTLSMQMAETLGIAVEDVKITVADTDSVGFTDGSWGSRTTFSSGWAVYKVGQELIGTLTQQAADLWDLDPALITFSDGTFFFNDQPRPFKQLVKELSREGHPVVASAAFQAGEVAPCFAAHLVDVEVDPETGKVQILRYTAVHEVGKAVHPGYVEGQIQGGTVQGIGWALNEGYVYDDQGHMLNTSFLDYRIPTCLDVPMIDTVIVEVPNPDHPFGVRGVGEIGIVPPPAALANAIHQAVGVRMDVLPMSPGRILEALWSQEKE